MTPVKPGRLEVQSPRLFDKLKNYVRAGSPVIKSTGVAGQVTTLPILVTANSGAVSVLAGGSVDKGYHLSLEGEGNVRVLLEHLSDSVEFAVQSNEGKRTFKASRTGSAAFDLDVKGKNQVVILIGR
ncbi:MAG: hypothetical protein ACPL7O_06805 [Armatimonadota bacterium]